ncbi:recombinase family protein [Streptomyces sp. NPDC004059]
MSAAEAKPDSSIRTAGSCARVFADKKSGKNAEREELWKCLDYLRPGDTLVVPSLDRLGRSIQDLIAIVSGLRKRDIGFQSLHEALDTTTPGGRLVFHVFAALAEFIRELIVQGTHEGLEAARARGGGSLIHVLAPGKATYQEPEGFRGSLCRVQRAGRALRSRPRCPSSDTSRKVAG